jgi:hypothetical protein
MRLDKPSQLVERIDSPALPGQAVQDLGCPVIRIVLVPDDLEDGLRPILSSLVHCASDR